MSNDIVSVDHRGGRWSAERPHVLVVACSDGRLQEETDDFLSAHLGISRYDRLYLPGGAGALSPSGREFTRAYQVRRECQFLVESHQVTDIVLLFHGPAATGPHEASCADYVRKLPWGRAADLRAQQERDAEELVRARLEWAQEARIHIFRCEIDDAGMVGFACLHHERTLATEREIEPSDRDAQSARTMGARTRDRFGRSPGS